MAKAVGNVTLEDGTGAPVVRLFCGSTHRPATIHWGGRVYHQNRQEPNGDWVYRAFWNAAGGTAEDDPFLRVLETFSVFVEA